MPIYSTTFNGEKRLIKASTIAGARNHLLKPLSPELTMLDAEGVAEAMGSGLKVEDASAPAPEPEPAVTNGGEPGDAKD